MSSAEHKGIPLEGLDNPHDSVSSLEPSSNGDTSEVISNDSGTSDCLPGVSVNSITTSNSATQSSNTSNSATESSNTSNLTRNSTELTLGAVGGGTILLEAPSQLSTHYSNKLSSRLQSSMSALDKKGKMYSKFYAHDPNDPNIKRVLEAVAGDHTVQTNPLDNKYRRTVVLKRQHNQSYGISLMSYVIRVSDSEMYRINYVENVQLASVAQLAGVRAGDIIVSINGRSVVEEDHDSIVTLLQSNTTLRLVLLFDNCVHKVELCTKAYKLQAMIEDKKLDLRMLELNEQRIINGIGPLGDSDLLSRVVSCDRIEYESCGSCSDVPSSPDIDIHTESVDECDVTTPSIEITRF